MAAAARNLLYAQLGFFACLLGCVAIDRRGLWDNHGWSYYGGRADTAFLYAVGFVLCIVFLLRSAALLDETTATAALPQALRLLALLLAVDFATPDTIDPLFNDAHITVSTVLFLFEFVLGVWIVLAAFQTRLGYRLLGTEFAGGLLAMFSQLQVLPLLGTGILVFQLAFGALLVAAIGHAVPIELEEAPLTEAAHQPHAGG
jgi:hypothetical protein